MAQNCPTSLTAHIMASYANNDREKIVKELSHLKEEDRELFMNKIQYFTHRFLSLHGVNTMDVLESVTSVTKNFSGAFLCCFESAEKALKFEPIKHAADRKNVLLSKLPIEVQRSLLFIEQKEIVHIKQNALLPFDISTQNLRRLSSEGLLIITVSWIKSSSPHYCTGWTSCKLMSHEQSRPIKPIQTKYPPKLLNDIWNACRAQDKFQKSGVATHRKFLRELVRDHLQNMFGISDFGFNSEELSTLIEKISEDLEKVKVSINDFEDDEPQVFLIVKCFEKHWIDIRECVEDCMAVCSSQVQQNRKQGQKQRQQDFVAYCTYFNDCLQAQEQNKGLVFPCLKCGRLNYAAPYKCRNCSDLSGFDTTTGEDAFLSCSRVLIENAPELAEKQVRQANDRARELKKLLRPKASVVQTRRVQIREVNTDAKEILLPADVVANKKSIKEKSTTITHTTTTSLGSIQMVQSETENIRVFNLLKEKSLKDNIPATTDGQRTKKKNRTRKNRQGDAKLARIIAAGELLLGV